MVVFIKPSGMEIEINDNPANIEAARTLGWKEKKKEVKKETKKATKKIKG